MLLPTVLLFSAAVFHSEFERPRDFPKIVDFIREKAPLGRTGVSLERGHSCG